MNGSLVRRRGPGLVPSRRALSGEEILDSLVAIADRFEAQFDERDLPRYHYLRGSGEPEDHGPLFGDVIDRIVADLDLEKDAQFSQPYLGWNQHNIVEKRVADPRLCPRGFRQDCWDALADETEVNQVLWSALYFMHASVGYVHRTTASDRLREIGVTSEPLLAFYDRVYTTFQRARGKRTREDTCAEIAALLAPNELTPPGAEVELFACRRMRLYAWRNRVFAVDEKDVLGPGSRFGHLRILIGGAIYSMDATVPWNEMVPFGYGFFRASGDRSRPLCDQTRGSFPVSARIALPEGI